MEEHNKKSDDDTADNCYDQRSKGFAHGSMLVQAQSGFRGEDLYFLRAATP
jgi:hypothetical protein